MLPAVSWIVPNGAVSEHPPSKVSVGQSYVTSLINAVMQGPDWSSSAIFLAWDDWGGFYDHVKPPTVDQNGYGLRVPGEEGGCDGAMEGAGGEPHTLGSAPPGPFMTYTVRMNVA